MMEIRPIKSEQDYELALQRVDALMDSEPNTPENDELDILVTLIEKYEEQNYPIDAPDPIEAILFRMEQLGLKQVDLAPYFGGSRSRVSEVLSRKRGLTVEAIRNLSNGLNIPAENLIQEYRTA